MSEVSYRTLANVTLILFEESVEFFISRSIPTGNIVHLFATDANVSATDTNNAQTWKLSKRYSAATAIPDVVYVRVTCSNGSVPTPPFFTISYTYYVTVVDARITFPSEELVLLTSAYNPSNRRSLEYVYDLPKNVGVVSLAPSTVSDPNPVSTFYLEDSDVPIADYGPPTVEVVPNGPGNYRLKINQSFGDAGVNDITFTLLFNRYNAYRKYALKYRVLQVGNVGVGGYAAAPFLVDMMSYDSLATTKGTIRYIEKSVANGEQLVLNSDEKFASALGGSTSRLESFEYYNTSVKDVADQLVGLTNNFPLVKFVRQDSFVYFQLDNQSTVADFRLTLARRIDFDNGAYIRSDPLVNKVFGFNADDASSSESPVTGLQTILADQALMCVTPPVISLELESIVNQHEGTVRQAQSVRLFQFLMVDTSCGYQPFKSYREFPERKLPQSSNRYTSLRFHFLYNRMNEVSNTGVLGIGLPVQFREPYYVTLRISNKNRDDSINESFITLYGTDPSPIISLDTPLEGLQYVELVDARIPRQAEAVVTADYRRAILGYVTDLSLPVVQEPPP